MAEALARRVLQICESLEQPLASPAAADGDLSDQARRSTQAKAYAHVLSGLGLLDDAQTVFVDLGAGSGLVSKEIHAALPRSGARFVLVDQRNKTPPNSAMCQLCADILSLDSTEQLRVAAHPLWQSGAPLVVVANHLCGSALDHSIELFAKERGLVGFCAATCCHDKAHWSSYCNQHFMASLGIGELEFRQLCTWSALAPRRNKRPAERARVCEVARELRMTDLAKCEQLGVACRLIIDTGRRLRLEALGMRSHLRHHVPFRITADNVLIVAHAMTGLQAAQRGRRDDPSASRHGHGHEALGQPTDE